MMRNASKLAPCNTRGGRPAVRAHYHHFGITDFLRSRKIIENNTTGSTDTPSSALVNVMSTHHRNNLHRAMSILGAATEIYM